MNQKEEEKLVMEYFRKSYPDFPKGKLVASESPDFVLRISPKKSIGIELTQLDRNADTLKEKLFNSLLKKDSKLSIYKNKFLNAYWLIIYVDVFEESENYNLHNKLDNWKFDSKYERVFLLDIFHKRIFELNVAFLRN